MKNFDPEHPESNGIGTSTEPDATAHSGNANIFPTCFSRLYIEFFVDAHREIVNAVTGAGLTLDGTDRTQLDQALIARASQALADAKAYVDAISIALAPATNTADYVPQWDGTNSKLLKNGKQIVTAMSGTPSDGRILTEKGVDDALTAGLGVGTRLGWGKIDTSVPSLTYGSANIGTVTSPATQYTGTIAFTALPSANYIVLWNTSNQSGHIQVTAQTTNLLSWEATDSNNDDTPAGILEFVIIGA